MKVYPVLASVLKSLFGYFVQSVDGVENLPPQGAFVLAANHASHLDQFLLLSQIIPLLDRKVHAVADKKTWFETSKLKSLIARYFEAIPIERGGGTSDGMLPILERLAAGGIVLLYPEGTRSLTGHLQRAKTGVARVALAAGAPVVPVGLVGTFDLLPKNQRWPDWSKRKSVRIRIGSPLNFDSLKARDEDASPGVYRRVTDQVMQEIAKLVGQPYQFGKPGPKEILETSAQVRDRFGRGSIDA
jgi:1-acyl-sn-glycerol-3-phosphate acyltransferase